MSNPTRAPTKEEVREYYEQNNVSLKECANHFGISENTVKSWKKRDKAKGDDWVHLIDSSGAPKGAEGKSKKQLINKAKSIVIQGGTIKEASEKTGVKESTLQNYSSKENWIEQQERFLKNVYGRLQEEEGEKHIQRRKEAIDYLNYIQKKTMAKLSNGDLDKKDAEIFNTVVNIVQKTIEGQAQLLGIPEMRLNIKKDTDNKDIPTSNDRKITIKVVK
ncbi:DUF1804 family protein [Fusobacterium mortiferum]|jgi:uncharacterized protein YjcR|uniref:DUF1804 domain-containing protein n=2 Tax=Fusobacterium mortiferum TaxID=850 RepID=A0ABN5JB76_FUSMR|nr:DUF1804 family protein [Fusobacterium mortiferum]AVQ19385.1 DUF1804 domain-containing protein [Fusobacterium mortiferum ATCC 9817]EEO36205.2 hypothetical protein FMAG_01767 [Fusobacterium mortiferum ATCC 9817]DAK52622.1 MAG TPA: Putative ATPase subunit of terminase (gpP like) [Caudoviricetes sp.]